MPGNDFVFRLVYFKPSGKFYTEATVTWNVKRLLPDGGPLMQDAIAKLRGLIASGGQGCMPGLSDQADGWGGPILIDCEQGHPCLLLPENDS